MLVRVKYCGGCNSGYDRPAFVKRLQDAFPSVHFVFSDAGGAPDFVLAVCGCPVACAAREETQEKETRENPESLSAYRFAVTSQSDFASACDAIRRAACGYS
jgi:hypothetical protein